MKKYLAPNGLPSNLSPEDWNYVRTPEFKEWFGDWEAYGLRDYLLAHEPVSTLDGTEFAPVEGVSLTEQVAAFFRAKDGFVLSPLYGKVILDEKGAEDSLAHGMGRLKAVAYAAVGDVVREGRVLSYEENHKGRGYDTVMLGAPIVIGGERYICQVVITLKKGHTPRFYLHEVTAQKKLLEAVSLTKASQSPSAPRGVFAKVLNNIVSNKFNCSKVLDANGEPRVLWHGSTCRFDRFDMSKGGQNTGLSEYTDKKTGEKVLSDASRAMFFTSSRDAAVSYAFLAIHNRNLQSYQALQGLIPIFGSLRNYDVRTREEFLQSCRVCEEYVPELKRVREEAEASPDKKIISGIVSGMTEGERSEIAEKLKAARADVESRVDMMRHGGISNMVNNYHRQREAVQSILKDVDRLRRNDLSVRNEFGDFNHYNMSITGASGNPEADIFEQDGRLKFLSHGISFFFDDATKDQIKAFRDRLNELVSASGELVEKELRENGFDEGIYLYKTFLRMENPLEHDYEGSAFPDMYKQSRYSTAYIAARQVGRAIADGRDGVVYRNVLDPFLMDSFGVFDADNVLIRDIQTNILTNRIEEPSMQETKPGRDGDEESLPGLTAAWQGMDFVHYGGEYDAGLFRPVVNRPNGLADKPLTGGLWASPVGSRWGWKDFVETEMPEREGELAVGSVFSLVPDARVYVIDSFEDLRGVPFRREKFDTRLLEKFSEDSDMKEVGRFIRDNTVDGVIDFEAMSRQYDAILLTERGAEQTKERFNDDGTERDCLDTWDVETLLVLNKDVITNVRRVENNLDKNRNDVIFAGNGTDYAQESRHDTHDRRNDSGGVAAGRARALALSRDLGDIRVLAQGLASTYRFDSGDGERDQPERVREDREISRLVDASRRAGLYIEPSSLDSLGEKVLSPSKESIVYINEEKSLVYKAKDPFRMSGMTGNRPEDAIFSHIIHNCYFPETAYHFEGVTMTGSTLRLVLSQPLVRSVRKATDNEAVALMKGKGMEREDAYTSGNALVAMKDYFGSNTLVGKDNVKYCIDPVICNRKPALEILSEKIGRDRVVKALSWSDPAEKDILLSAEQNNKTQDIMNSHENMANGQTDGASTKDAQDSRQDERDIHSGMDNPAERYYVGDIVPEPDVVFVFGSNPEGRHGAGAARVARQQFGAVYGQGEGLQGNAYALPTKDLRVKENRGLRSIPPERIIASIRRLYDCARENPTKVFKIAYRNVDRASLNGYTGYEMIRMFLDAGEMPANVKVSEEWFKTGMFGAVPDMKLLNKDDDGIDASAEKDAGDMMREGETLDGKNNPEKDDNKIKITDMAQNKKKAVGFNEMIRLDEGMLGMQIIDAQTGQDLIPGYVVGKHDYTEDGLAGELIPENADDENDYRFELSVKEGRVDFMIEQSLYKSEIHGGGEDEDPYEERVYVGTLKMSREDFLTLSDEEKIERLAVQANIGKAAEPMPRGIAQFAYNNRLRQSGRRETEPITMDAAVAKGYDNPYIVVPGRAGVLEEEADGRSRMRLSDGTVAAPRSDSRRIAASDAMQGITAAPVDGWDPSRVLVVGTDSVEGARRLGVYGAGQEPDSDETSRMVSMTARIDDFFEQRPYGPVDVGTGEEYDILSDERFSSKAERPFEVDGKRFSSVYQWYNWNIAMFAGDQPTADAILAEDNLENQRLLVMKVKRFNKALWNAGKSDEVLWQGVRASFLAHPEILLSTGARTLVVEGATQGSVQAKYPEMLYRIREELRAGRPLEKVSVAPVERPVTVEELRAQAVTLLDEAAAHPDRQYLLDFGGDLDAYLPGGYKCGEFAGVFAEEYLRRAERTGRLSNVIVPNEWAATGMFLTDREKAAEEMALPVVNAEGRDDEPQCLTYRKEDLKNDGSTVLVFDGNSQGLYKVGMARSAVRGGFMDPDHKGGASGIAGPAAFEIVTKDLEKSKQMGIYFYPNAEQLVEFNRSGFLPDDRKNFPDVYRRLREYYSAADGYDAVFAHPEALPERSVSPEDIIAGYSLMLQAAIDDPDRTWCLEMADNPMSIGSDGYLAGEKYAMYREAVRRTGLDPVNVSIPHRLAESLELVETEDAALGRDINSPLTFSPSGETVITLYDEIDGQMVNPHDAVIRSISFLPADRDSFEVTFAPEREGAEPQTIPLTSGRIPDKEIVFMLVKVYTEDMSKGDMILASVIQDTLEAAKNREYSPKGLSESEQRRVYINRIEKFIDNNSHDAYYHFAEPVVLEDGRSFASMTGPVVGLFNGYFLDYDLDYGVLIKDGDRERLASWDALSLSELALVYNCVLREQAYKSYGEAELQKFVLREGKITENKGLSESEQRRAYTNGIEEFARASLNLRYYFAEPVVLEDGRLITGMVDGLELNGMDEGGAELPGPDCGVIIKNEDKTRILDEFYSPLDALSLSELALVYKGVLRDQAYRSYGEAELQKFVLREGKITVNRESPYVARLNAFKSEADMLDQKAAEQEKQIEAVKKEYDLANNEYMSYMFMFPNAEAIKSADEATRQKLSELQHRKDDLSMKLDRLSSHAQSLRESSTSLRRSVDKLVAALDASPELRRDDAIEYDFGMPIAAGHWFAGEEEAYVFGLRVDKYWDNNLLKKMDIQEARKIFAQSQLDGSRRQYPYRLELSWKVAEKDGEARMYIPYEDLDERQFIFDGDIIPDIIDSISIETFVGGRVEILQGENGHYLAESDSGRNLTPGFTVLHAEETPKAPGVIRGTMLPVGARDGEQPMAFKLSKIRGRWTLRAEAQKAITIGDAAPEAKPDSLKLYDVLRFEQAHAEPSIGDDRFMTPSEDALRNYSYRTAVNAAKSSFTAAFAFDFETNGEVLTARSCGVEPCGHNDVYRGFSLTPDMLTEDRYREQAAADGEILAESLFARSLVDGGQLTLNIAGNAVARAMAAGVQPFEGRVSDDEMVRRQAEGRSSKEDDEAIARDLAGVQLVLNAYMTEVVSVAKRILSSRGVSLSFGRSGGQTGFDMAGIAAFVDNGIPATVYFPKDFRMQDPTKVARLSRAGNEYVPSIGMYGENPVDVRTAVYGEIVAKAEARLGEGGYVQSFPKGNDRFDDLYDELDDIEKEEEMEAAMSNDGPSLLESILGPQGGDEDDAGQEQDAAEQEQRSSSKRKVVFKSGSAGGVTFASTAVISLGRQRFNVGGMTAQAADMAYPGLFVDSEKGRVFAKDAKLFRSSAARTSVDVSGKTYEEASRREFPEAFRREVSLDASFLEKMVFASGQVLSLNGKDIPVGGLSVKSVIDDYIIVPDTATALPHAGETWDIWFGNPPSHPELSNMAPRPFVKGGRQFHCVEQYFQWCKAIQAADEETAEKILNCENGLEAKALGSRVKNLDVDSWNKISAAIMEEGIRASFQANPDVLLSTGGATLTHKRAAGSRWAEDFPRILMQERERLRFGRPAAETLDRTRIGRLSPFFDEGLTPQQMGENAYLKGVLPLIVQWKEHNPVVYKELFQNGILAQDNGYELAFADPDYGTGFSPARALAAVLDQTGYNKDDPDYSNLSVLEASRWLVNVDLVRRRAEEARQKSEPVTDLTITGDFRATARLAREAGGVNMLRVVGSEEHFGNPFSPLPNSSAAVKVPSAKAAVEAFEAWLTGADYRDIEPERRQWIVGRILSGELIGKQLFYYTDKISSPSGYPKGEDTYDKDLRPNYAHILMKYINDPVQLSDRINGNILGKDAGQEGEQVEWTPSQIRVHGLNMYKQSSRKKAPLGYGELGRVWPDGTTTLVVVRKNAPGSSSDNRYIRNAALEQEAARHGAKVVYLKGLAADTDGYVKEMRDIKKRYPNTTGETAKKLAARYAELKSKRDKEIEAFGKDLSQLEKMASGQERIFMLVDELSDNGSDRHSRKLFQSIERRGMHVYHQEKGKTQSEVVIGILKGDSLIEGDTKDISFDTINNTYHATSGARLRYGSWKAVQEARNQILQVKASDKPLNYDGMTQVLKLKNDKGPTNPRKELEEAARQVVLHSTVVLNFGGEVNDKVVGQLTKKDDDDWFIREIEGGPFVINLFSKGGKLPAEPHKLEDPEYAKYVASRILKVLVGKITERNAIAEFVKGLQTEGDTLGILAPTDAEMEVKSFFGRVSDEELKYEGSRSVSSSSMTREEEVAINDALVPKKDTTGGTTSPALRVVSEESAEARSGGMFSIDNETDYRQNAVRTFYANLLEALRDAPLQAAANHDGLSPNREFDDRLGYEPDKLSVFKIGAVLTNGDNGPLEANNAASSIGIKNYAYETPSHAQTLRIAGESSGRAIGTGSRISRRRLQAADAATLWGNRLRQGLRRRGLSDSERMAQAKAWHEGYLASKDTVVRAPGLTDRQVFALKFIGGLSNSDIVYIWQMAAKEVVDTPEKLAELIRRRTATPFPVWLEPDLPKRARKYAKELNALDKKMKDITSFLDRRERIFTELDRLKEEARKDAAKDNEAKVAYVREGIMNLGFKDIDTFATYSAGLFEEELKSGKPLPKYDRSRDEEFAKKRAEFEEASSRYNAVSETLKEFYERHSYYTAATVEEALSKADARVEELVSEGRIPVSLSSGLYPESVREMIDSSSNVLTKMPVIKVRNGVINAETPGRIVDISTEYDALKEEAESIISAASKVRWQLTRDLGLDDGELAAKEDGDTLVKLRDALQKIDKGLMSVRFALSVSDAAGVTMAARKDRVGSLVKTLGGSIAEAAALTGMTDVLNEKRSEAMVGALNAVGEKVVAFGKRVESFNETVMKIDKERTVIENEYKTVTERIPSVMVFEGDPNLLREDIQPKMTVMGESHSTDDALKAARLVGSKLASDGFTVVAAVGGEEADAFSRGDQVIVNHNPGAAGEAVSAALDKDGKAVLVVAGSLDDPNTKELLDKNVKAGGVNVTETFVKNEQDIEGTERAVARARKVSLYAGKGARGVVTVLDSASRSLSGSPAQILSEYLSLAGEVGALSIYGVSYGVQRYAEKSLKGMKEIAEQEENRPLVTEGQMEEYDRLAEDFKHRIEEKNNEPVRVLLRQTSSDEGGKSCSVTAFTRRNEVLDGVFSDSVSPVVLDPEDYDLIHGQMTESEAPMQGLVHDGEVHLFGEPYGPWTAALTAVSGGRSVMHETSEAADWLKDEDQVRGVMEKGVMHIFAPAGSQKLQEVEEMFKLQVALPDGSTGQVRYALHVGENWKADYEAMSAAHIHDDDVDGFVYDGKLRIFAPVFEGRLAGIMSGIKAPVFLHPEKDYAKVLAGLRAGNEPVRHDRPALPSFERVRALVDGGDMHIFVDGTHLNVISEIERAVRAHVIVHDPDEYVAVKNSLEKVAGVYESTTTGEKTTVYRRDRSDGEGSASVEDRPVSAVELTYDNGKVSTDFSTAEPFAMRTWTNFCTSVAILQEEIRRSLGVDANVRTDGFNLTLDKVGGVCTLTEDGRVRATWRFSPTSGIVRQEVESLRSSLGDENGHYIRDERLLPGARTQAIRNDIQLKKELDELRAIMFDLPALDDRRAVYDRDSAESVELEKKRSEGNLPAGRTVRNIDIMKSSIQGSPVGQASGLPVPRLRILASIESRRKDLAARANALEADIASVLADAEQVRLLLDRPSEGENRLDAREKDVIEARIPDYEKRAEKLQAERLSILNDYFELQRQTERMAAAKSVTLLASTGDERNIKVGDTVTVCADGEVITTTVVRMSAKTREQMQAVVDEASKNRTRAEIITGGGLLRKEGVVPSSAELIAEYRKLTDQLAGYREQLERAHYEAQQQGKALHDLLPAYDTMKADMEAMEKRRAELSSKVWNAEKLNALLEGNVVSTHAVDWREVPKADICTEVKMGTRAWRLVYDNGIPYYEKITENKNDISNGRIPAEGRLIAEFKVDGKPTGWFGYVDLFGNTVSDYLYREVCPMSPGEGGVGLAKTNDGKYCFVGRNGREVMPVQGARMKESEFDGQYRFDAIWPSGGNGVYKVKLDGKYNVLDPKTGEYVAKKGWFDNMGTDCYGYVRIEARMGVDPMTAFERDSIGNPIMDKDGHYIPMYNYLDVRTGKTVFSTWIKSGQDLRRPSEKEMSRYGLDPKDKVAYISDDNDTYSLFVVKPDGRIFRKKVTDKIDITVNYSTALKRNKK